MASEQQAALGTCYCNGMGVVRDPLHPAGRPMTCQGPCSADPRCAVEGCSLPEGHGYSAHWTPEDYNREH